MDSIISCSCQNKHTEKQITFSFQKSNLLSSCRYIQPFKSLRRLFPFMVSQILLLIVLLQHTVPMLRAPGITYTSVCQLYNYVWDAESCLPFSACREPAGKSPGRLCGPESVWSLVLWNTNTLWVQVTSTDYIYTFSRLLLYYTTLSHLNSMEASQQPDFIW